MMDDTTLSVAEFAAAVQEALRKAGVEVVLSGGSCVSVWSNNAYRSDDIDLIPVGLATRPNIRRVMIGLGFTEKNRYFIHPNQVLWVEFPNGPLGVGEEMPREISSLAQKTGMLRLLSPTDCVKDRLTWWYHDKDRQGLEQAVAVAQRHSVDIAEVRRWSVGEGCAAAFELISKRLESG